ncbi:MAG: Fe-S cluster assembly protein SufB, partial [Erysipelotrichaceae bacterium]
MTNKPDAVLPSSDYQYGFSDKDVSVYNTGKGISKEIVEEISHIKNEPQWMTDYRLRAFESFLKKPMPTWGVDLSSLDFSEYTYYIKPSDRMGTTWDEVPETIKDTFERLGIPEAERKFLSGVSTQYESEVVYHNMLAEVEDKGVIFLDTDSALRDHPDLFRKFFGTVVGFADNKF